MNKSTASMNINEEKLFRRGFGIPRRRVGEMYTFVVEGESIFPVDMLRYDCCYPARQEDVEAMGHTRNYPKGLQRVELKSQFVPTDDRWRSFGWKVVDLR